MPIGDENDNPNDDIDIGDLFNFGKKDEKQQNTQQKTIEISPKKKEKILLFVEELGYMEILYLEQVIKQIRNTK